MLKPQALALLSRHRRACVHYDLLHGLPQGERKKTRTGRLRSPSGRRTVLRMGGGPYTSWPRSLRLPSASGTNIFRPRRAVKGCPNDDLAFSEKNESRAHLHRPSRPRSGHRGDGGGDPRRRSHGDRSAGAGGRTRTRSMASAWAEVGSSRSTASSSATVERTARRAPTARSRSATASLSPTAAAATAPSWSPRSRTGCSRSRAWSVVVARDVEIGNAPSRRALERAGFSVERVDGEHASYQRGS